MKLQSQSKTSNTLNKEIDKHIPGRGPEGQRDCTGEFSEGRVTAAEQLVKYTNSNVAHQLFVNAFPVVDSLQNMHFKYM